MGRFRIRWTTKFAALAIAAGSVSTAVLAQPEDGADGRLEALNACRSIEENSARLACYDQQVAAVIADRDSGEIKVVGAEDIRETRRGLFGFSMPKTGIFAATDEEQTTLRSRITNLRQVRSDYWEVTIEEGSVWRASDTPRRFKPRVGDEVELEEAALGSYWLRVNGALGVKARRIR